MIYIDAREGVSGDMLLAAMIDLLRKTGTKDISARLAKASREQGLEFVLQKVEEGGDSGLMLSYSGELYFPRVSSYEETFTRLEDINRTVEADPRTSKTILDCIMKAEAEVHRVPLESVHLHEIGRPQALLNISGISLAASELLRSGADGFISSTITTGRGTVVVAHGAVRVPAPASAVLLRDMKHLPGDAPGERATPTGIAAVKILSKSQSDDFPRDPRTRGVGFGGKSFGGRLGRTIVAWP